MAAVTQQFTYFPRLPRELRDMVWKDFQQSRSSTFHHFELIGNDRYYWAYSSPASGGPPTSKVIDLRKWKASILKADLMPWGQPVSLPGYQISLPEVKLAPNHDRSIVRAAWNVRRAVPDVLPAQPLDPLPCTWIYPAAFWADFEKDTFHFSQDEREHDSIFAFLSEKSYYTEEPLDLDNDHWIFKIQKLAIDTRGWDCPSTGFFTGHDLDILLRMRDLRDVYIVHRTELDQWFLKYSPSGDRWDHERAYLRRFFHSHGRNVAVGDLRDLPFVGH